MVNRKKNNNSETQDIGLNNNNIYNYPANVTGPVRASQLLSLMYSILVQDNLIGSLYTVRNGYNHAAMQESFPDCGAGNKHNPRLRAINSPQ